MYIKKIIPFVMLCILSSCTKTRNTFVDISEIETIINWVDRNDIAPLFRDFHIIALDSVLDGQISSVEKVMVTNNGIFVLDSKKMRKLLLFDNNGNFVRQIGKIGHANSEMNIVLDACVTENGDSIYLMDWQSVKLFDSYGHYLKSYEIKDSIDYRHFNKVQNGFACVSNYTGTSNLVHLCDTGLNIKNQFANAEKKIIKGSPYIKRPLWYSHNKTIFYDFYSSSFYVKEDNNNRINRYMLKSPNILTIDKITDRNWDYGRDYILDYWYDGNCIWGSMVYKTFLCSFKFELSKNKFIVYESFEFNPKVYNYNNGYYYTCISPEDLYRIQNVPDSILTPSRRKISDELTKLKIKVKKNDNYYIIKMNY